MKTFLADVGMLVIAFMVLYGYKKVLEYYHYKRSGFYENEKIYKAANEFVHGASSVEISKIIASCLDFDKEDAEKIIKLSIPYRTDEDGGYSAFIRSVNNVLGVNVYNEKRHK